MFSFFYDGFPADSTSVVSILFSSLNAKRGTLTITLLMNSSCLAAATLYLSGQGHVSALEECVMWFRCTRCSAFPSVRVHGQTRQSLHSFCMPTTVNQHDNGKAETIACFTQEVICRELPEMIDCTCSNFPLIYLCLRKKVGHLFHNFFTAKFRKDLRRKLELKLTPSLMCVAALPCEK